MVQVKAYKLPPTTLIPNSPYPLLHYQGLLSGDDLKPSQIHEKFDTNGWKTHWIFRYGPTQQSHYHSGAHECMAVLTGTATIRFGVADTTDDLEESTYGSGHETGGVEIHAKAGDVFILPAGTAHKTHDTTPAEFALLTPGKAKGIEADDPKKALSEIKLDGFTMMGAYPKGSLWDFAVGQEDDGKHFGEVWSVPKPERDPLLGGAREGLVGLWVERKRDSKL
ncbi:hypothetical protein PRZ48_007194 [Zasmidium cellare]|uniref:Cupin type-1 domain-containing protein n=1 Tax=Zasmidium cellare TaxID=395010 RepID=A0ABR0EJI5_ZASCE|nr:hypothetical protein PRZ48_007194 [Zasmidium cellare]